MLNQKDTKSRNLYKILFWALLSVLAVDYLLNSVVGGIADADDLVIKKEVKGGAWIYVTHYGAPATDLDTLRFYISNQLQGTDQEILKQLNELSSFMITDSNVQDVVIRDTQNGVGIDVKGAVYNYYSKQYTNGEKFKSYRVSLNQQDERN